MRNLCSENVNSEGVGILGNLRGSGLDLGWGCAGAEDLGSGIWEPWGLESGNLESKP